MGRNLPADPLVVSIGGTSPRPAAQVAPETNPLAAHEAAGPARLLWGLQAVQRAIPRPGMPVLLDGVRIGEVTSGTFSPTRKVGIGLALLDTTAVPAEGAEVQVDIRGRLAPMQVVSPPFVPSSVR